MAHARVPPPSTAEGMAVAVAAASVCSWRVVRMLPSSRGSVDAARRRSVLLSYENRHLIE
jgi:hypothetical protein